MILISLSIGLLRWLLNQIFLFTDWFDGTHQFLIQQMSYFVLDVYLMLYIPCTWIKKSKQNNWAGWALKKGREKQFSFVRKPDPREELKRKGYFKRSGHFAYMRKTTVAGGKNSEKRTDLSLTICNDCVLEDIE